MTSSGTLTLRALERSIGGSTATPPTGFCNTATQTNTNVTNSSVRSVIVRSIPMPQS